MLRRLLAHFGYVPRSCAHDNLGSTHTGADVRADGEVWLDLTIRCDDCPREWSSEFSTGLKMLRDDTKKPIARA